MMEWKNIDELKKDLVAAGWEADPDRIKDLVPVDANKFLLFHLDILGDDKCQSSWIIEAKEKEKYRINGVEFTLIKAPDFPQEIILGLDVEDLDKRLRAIDWFNTDTYVKEMYNTGSHVHKAMRDMSGLYYLGPVGRDTHDILAYKHFSGTPAESMIGYIDALKQKYDRKVHFDPTKNSFTKGEIINLLEGRFVNKKNLTGEGEPNKWFKASFEQKDVYGFSEITEIKSNVILENAFVKAGIMDSEVSSKNNEILNKLFAGDVVTLIMQNNNLEGKRAFYIDPEKGMLKIDNKETAKRGFYDEIVRDIPVKQQDVGLNSKPEMQSEKDKGEKGDLPEEDDRTENKRKRR